MLFDQIVQKNWKVIGLNLRSLFNHRVDFCAPCGCVESLDLNSSDIMTTDTGLIQDSLAPLLLWKYRPGGQGGRCCCKDEANPNRLLHAWDYTSFV